MPNTTPPPSWENECSWAEKEIARWNSPKATQAPHKETEAKTEEEPQRAVAPKTNPVGAKCPETMPKRTTAAPAAPSKTQPPIRQHTPEEDLKHWKHDGNRFWLSIVAFLIYWGVMLSPALIAAFVYSVVKTEYIFLLIFLIPFMPILAYFAANKATKGKVQGAIRVCIGIYGFLVWNFTSHGLRSVLFSENFWIAIIVIIILVVPIELTLYWSLKKGKNTRKKKKRTKTSDPSPESSGS